MAWATESQLPEDTGRKVYDIGAPIYLPGRASDLPRLLTECFHAFEPGLLTALTGFVERSSPEGFLRFEETILRMLMGVASHVAAGDSPVGALLGRGDALPDQGASPSGTQDQSGVGVVMGMGGRRTLLGAQRGIHGLSAGPCSLRPGHLGRTRAGQQRATPRRRSAGRGTRRRACPTPYARRSVAGWHGRRPSWA